MPSVSPAQKHLMAAVAHGWHKPGGGGPSVAVAKEFNRADAAMNKGYRGATQKFAQGGPVLGKESSFLKVHDEFREADEGERESADVVGDTSDEDQNYAKSGAGAGKGCIQPPAQRGKSLSPVKPRK